MRSLIVSLGFVFAFYVSAQTADARYLMETGGFNLHPYARGTWNTDQSDLVVDRRGQQWNSAHIPVSAAASAFDQYWRYGQYSPPMNGQAGTGGFPIPSHVAEYMDGNNLYGYVGENPINYLDSSGLVRDVGWGWPSPGDYGAYFWPWGGNEEIDPIFGIPGNTIQGGAIITAGTATAAAGTCAATGFSPWLGTVAKHAAHAGGPHRYPHIQIMIRTGARRTSHIRIPWGK